MPPKEENADYGRAKLKAERANKLCRKLMAECEDLVRCGKVKESNTLFIEELMKARYASIAADDDLRFSAPMSEEEFIDKIVKLATPITQLNRVYDYIERRLRYSK